MLNNFFIASGSVSFIQKFLDGERLNYLSYREKLKAIGSGKGLSYEQWWSLLQELQELCDYPALGLRIGRYITVSDCGVLGYLTQTSRNLGEALACFVRFQRLLYSGGEAYTEIGSDGAFHLIWDASEGYSSQLSDDLLLAGLVNVNRCIMEDSALTPLTVEFPHSAPESAAVYESFFGCPVLFGRSNLQLCYATDMLKRPIPGQDASLHQLLGQQAEALLAQVPEDDTFLADLREALIRSLPEGRPTVDFVAKQMALSERTIHRRLNDRHLVFRDVLRELRQILAKQYLQNDQLSQAEISLLLGYTEQSAFSRAFVGWFSLTPGQYRKSLK